ncbi:MAG TPA: ribosome small subunit-dependent GTPase A [Feifaniaceae bacterium]|nr:ribosome small subunit-dependent GTPase A [Feifaniaceae bacterium]
MQEKGLLLKGVGGYYTVRLEQGEEITAQARGRFRHEGLSPVCGDQVLIERQQEGHAALVEILPRKNILIRPQVANIDQLVIVLSASRPKPDLLLCDKLMLQAIPLSIVPLIVVNKCDEGDSRAVEDIRREYAHVDTLILSARTGEGLKPLRHALKNKVNCFAGQSAVGKSSLLNALLPGLGLLVGGLARRTDRGRHTTRHVELWPYEGGAVLDTPGFSLLELSALDQETLNAAYPEFSGAPSKCRFAACSHRTEPGCAVKELLQNGTLSPGRYARYVELCTQFEELRRNRYH